MFLCIQNTKKGCERIINFTTETDEACLRIEVRNSVAITIKFEEGLPITTKKDGGTGAKSIARIVEKNGGMFRFKQENNTFITQLILPLK